MKRHNDLRSIVSPTAKKMRKMTWDKELSEVATAYTRKCVYEHNPVTFCFCTWTEGADVLTPSLTYSQDRNHSRFGVVGENLYISVGTPWSTDEVTGAVSAWDEEKKDYDYQTRNCKPGKKCGHYTQVRLIYLFCGIALCALCVSAM